MPSGRNLMCPWPPADGLFRVRRSHAMKYGWYIAPDHAYSGPNSSDSLKSSARFAIISLLLGVRIDGGA